MNTLERIINSTHEDLRQRKEATSLADLERKLASGGDDRPFSEALARPGLSIISEYKRSSPSAGMIREDIDVAELVTMYEEGGAAALSILTEGRHFGGSLDDLRAAKQASSLPILRKDFIVDPYQIVESAVAGADAILLIVAALEKRDLEQFYSDARGLDLDVLVEVHDQAELETALEIDADAIGINNRDLTDFTVDIERTFELLSDVPAGKTVVSESGFSTKEQLDELHRVGVDAVLIGETLMRAEDPKAQLIELASVHPE